MTREADVVPGCPTRPVLLRGTPAAVALAKAEIARVIEDKNNQPRPMGQYGQQMDATCSVKIKVCV